AVSSLLGLGGSLAETEILTRVLLDDGTILSVPADAAAGAAAIQRYSPRDAAKWPAFTSMLRGLSGFLEAMYQLPAPDLDSSAVADLPGMITLGRSYRALGRANMRELLRVLPMPVQDLADDWLTFEPLKAAVAAAGVREIRQGPRSGGTSFVLLHHLTGGSPGTVRGRRQLKGGPGAFIAAAEGAAKASGVTIRTGTRVRSIDIEDDRVRSVTLTTGETIPANAVLSTADPASTFLGMVDPVWLDPEFVLALGNIKYRGSTAYVCYRLEQSAEPSVDQGLVNLSSSTDAIERPFDAAKYGEASPMPHIEYSIPAGGRVLIARVHYIPHTPRTGAWDAGRREALGDLVSSRIARAIPGFGNMARERLVLTPDLLEERFGVTDGALTHGEITLDQVLFMRPVAGWGRYATPIAGLYLGGAGTHPGPGIAGGSGWLAARRVLADWRKK
ncbi:MAG TPA: NAD(P)/FAD-dependent oxidoreductase, partial [Gemmatimonadaceae bacterium]|nr:NAD(P)/FAD-dependent oxidoreductase [Gemmatimonadaceae bacterium]